MTLPFGTEDRLFFGQYDKVKVKCGRRKKVKETNCNGLSYTKKMEILAHDSKRNRYVDQKVDKRDLFPFIL